MRRTLIAGMWVYAAVTFSQTAFPGVQGFGASATGGRGGKVIYVTNLNVSGPGSCRMRSIRTGRDTYFLK